MQGSIQVADSRVKRLNHFAIKVPEWPSRLCLAGLLQYHKQSLWAMGYSVWKQKRCLQKNSRPFTFMILNKIVVIAIVFTHLG